MFLLFPTGQLRSPRWRPAAWFVGGVFALIAVDLLVNATRLWSDPYSQAGNPLVLAPLLILPPVALVVSVAAVVVRFAWSAGEERLQLKWFAAAALLAVATLLTSDLANSVVANVLNNLAFLCLWAAIAIAVLKYRLYEIDIVISKAVLYGSLAIFITAVYAGLVAGVGTAWATGIVRCCRPWRRRWWRWCSSRPGSGRGGWRTGWCTAGAPPPIRCCRSSPSASAAPTRPSRCCRRWRTSWRTGPAPSGSWCGCGWMMNSAQGLLRMAAGTRLRCPSMATRCRLPGTDMSVPVVHQGELLGAISVAMPKDEPLRPPGQQLVADVASQAGLVLANAGLIEDLRASRQRLVTAQDETRRRLERNIHDGAQQDLVALGIKLRLGGMTVAEDPAQAEQIFGELQADATGALENLRDLARGIYPPLLADLGLAAALNAQASKSPLPVAVEADGIGRLPQDTEAAVYFCCLEALQNTAKYAHASTARICVQAKNATLCFTVSDDGTGYDTRHTPMGSGLRNMADRLAALGGRLEVRSARSQGTAITGHLPVPSTSSNH